MNPHLPRVRREAVYLVKQKGWSTRKVARYFGYTQSTIVKWCKKDETGGFRKIETRSSRPKTSPRALPRDIVAAIISKRVGRHRCGQVVHRELLADGLSVSLSSVQRTLNTAWQDNLGATFVHPSTSGQVIETIYSTSTVDVTIAGTTTIDYWATYYPDPSATSSAQTLHATRTVVMPAPVNDNPANTTVSSANPQLITA